MFKQQPKTRVQGHSIWLVPDVESCDIIEQVILELSQQFNSPVFQPHLTLLGQLPGSLENIIPPFQELGRACPTLILRPMSVGIQNIFYRSLYYEISKSPHLNALHDKARTLLDRRSDIPFFPHISLLYSSAPESTKQAVIKKLLRSLPKRIPISHIALMRTQGEVEDWKLVERIELK